MDGLAAVEGPSRFIDGVIAEGLVVIMAKAVQGQWGNDATGTGEGRGRFAGVGGAFPAHG